MILRIYFTCICSLFLNTFLKKKFWGFFTLSFSSFLIFSDVFYMFFTISLILLYMFIFTLYYILLC